MSGLLDAISTAQVFSGPPYLKGSGVAILRVSRMQLNEAGKTNGKLRNASFCLDGVVLHNTVQSSDSKNVPIKSGMLARANASSKFSEDVAVVACRQAVAAGKTTKDGVPFPESSVNKAIAEKAIGQDQVLTGAIVKVVCNESATGFTNYTFMAPDESDFRNLKEVGVI
jgi:hypothetical protein